MNVRLPGTFRAFRAYWLGPVAASLLGLATVPGLAWLFPPETLGLVDLFILTATLAGLCLSLGLDKALLSEYHRSYHRSESPEMLVRASLLPAGGAFLLFAVALVLLDPPLGGMLFDHRLAHWQPLLLTATGSLLLQRFLGQLARVQEDGWGYSASLLLPKLVTAFALPVLWVMTDRGLFELALISVIGISLCALALALRQRRFLRRALTQPAPASRMRHQLALGVPFLAYGLLYVALTSTGSWVLRHSSTLLELGQYAMALRIASAAALAQSIFSTIWLPWAYRQGDEPVNGEAMSGATLPANAAALIAIQRPVVAVITLVFCGAGMASLLLRPLLPAAYHPALLLLPAAAGTPMLHGLAEVTGIGLQLARRTWVTATVIGLALAANLAITLSLAPSLGARGAVIGSLLGFYLAFVLRTEWAARSWRTFPRRALHLRVGALTAAAAACALLPPGNEVWIFLGWFGLAALTGWVFRADLKRIVPTLSAQAD